MIDDVLNNNQANICVVINVVDANRNRLILAGNLDKPDFNYPKTDGEAQLQFFSHCSLLRATLGTFCSLGRAGL